MCSYKELLKWCARSSPRSHNHTFPTCVDGIQGIYMYMPCRLYKRHIHVYAKYEMYRSSGASSMWQNTIFQEKECKYTKITSTFGTTVISSFNLGKACLCTRSKPNMHGTGSAWFILCVAKSTRPWMTRCRLM